jgi:YVTN family beta-propeller protein
MIVFASSSAVLLRDNTYAAPYSLYPEVHENTLYEIANQSASKQIAHIPIGNAPETVGVDRDTNTIYVANYIDNTVSVIDGRNNTKIGDDIPVGTGPTGIGLNSQTNTIYVANSEDNTVSVIDGENNTKIGDDIPVGKDPEAIGVNEDTNTIYAANNDSNTISVIDGENNTKIGDDIPVGKGPIDIVVNPSDNLIYVAYQDNNFVSVINGTNYNNTKIGEDISVGKGPNTIGANLNTNTMYVANYGSNSISLINLTDNTKIGHDVLVGKGPEDIDVNRATNTIYVAHDNDTISVIDGKNNTQLGSRIPVGKGPNAIGVNWDTNTIYVANNWDNSITVIDGKANKVIAQVTFNTQPFNGGRIECDKDKLTAPLGRQFYVYSGTLCTAKPNQGFEFVSWQENLGGNSTQLLKFSSPPNIGDTILDFFNMKPDKKEAGLNITKFGSFTANFNPLPPPIPPQYTATLITVVITAFIGTWLTPTIIQWRNRRKQGSKLDHYHNEVKKLYNDGGELNSNKIEELNNLGYQVTEEYIRGKINKEQYDKLVNEISVGYSEIFTKEIDSLNTLSKNAKVEQISRVKNNIENAYAKGRINELHHTLLKNRLVHYEKNE